MSWRNNKESRKNTPKKEHIYKYWNPYWPGRKLPTIRNNEFIEGEENCCFACGHFSNIERCHIKPLCDGGENNIDNLHLLCRSCHSVSEGNPNYWKWLSYMREKEWKSRSEWIFKIIEMNGVDVDAWMINNESIRGTREWFKALLMLQLSNGIECIPKADIEEDWRELIEEANREYRSTSSPEQVQAKELSAPYP